MLAPLWPREFSATEAHSFALFLCARDTFAAAQAGQWAHLEQLVSDIGKHSERASEPKAAGQKVKLEPLGRVATFDAPLGRPNWARSLWSGRVEFGLGASSAAAGQMGRLACAQLNLW